MPKARMKTDDGFLTEEIDLWRLSNKKKKEGDNQKTLRRGKKP